MGGYDLVDGSTEMEECKCTTPTPPPLHIAGLGEKIDGIDNKADENHIIRYREYITW